MSLPRRSEWFFRGFRKYARRYIARHFHALRVDRDGPAPVDPTGPLVVAMNHASWWDPMTAVVLSELLGAGRAHYAPMDQQGLDQYRVLERLGIFGVELESARGGIAFLRKATAILGRPESVLWITPQGRFADARERPTRFREGLGRLLHRTAEVSVIPLAIEYPFWNDRRPELLVRFGGTIAVGDGGARPAEDWTRLVESALEEAQDALAASSCSRDASRFEALIAGSAGVGGVYDLGRRLRSALRGEAFSKEHRIHR
ncbi:lysophospholipid acyltransferase family protein [Paludisphaera sp.]|uniref:lysophospholipid acyltransferase family protein n=1 Tax=Paludisphaera sp. TaxID=2017432 RepID=UPI00301E3D7D